MAAVTITGLPIVSAANLDDTAVVEVDDKLGQTRKATIAQLRTALAAAAWTFAAAVTLNSTFLQTWSSNSALTHSIRNTSAGTSAQVIFKMGNDAVDELLVLRAVSSTWTFSSGMFGAGRNLIESASPNGLHVGTTNNADVVWYSNNTARLTLASSGLFTVQGAPAGNWSQRVIGNGTTGQSYGLYVTAGTNSSDKAFEVANQAVTQNFFTVRGDGAIMYPSLGTTASASNAFLDSGDSNRLLRSTSSLRYKTNVRSMEADRSLQLLRALRPVLFNSRADSDNPERTFVGLVAEEVWAIPGEGKRYVHLDAKGRPDGLAYAQLTVPLTLGWQDHESRISALEARQN